MEEKIVIDKGFYIKLASLMFLISALMSFVFYAKTGVLNFILYMILFSLLILGILGLFFEKLMILDPQRKVFINSFGFLLKRNMQEIPFVQLKYIEIRGYSNFEDFIWEVWLVINSQQKVHLKNFTAFDISKAKNFVKKIKTMTNLEVKSSSAAWNDV